MNKSHLLCAVAASVALASTARAADHTNLEPGLPLEVEDAYPTGYLNREFQLSGRYQRTADGKNQYRVDPRLEYGFARNWQARINVPLTFGSGDKRGSGDIGAELFYNFNTESLKTPAFAASVSAQAPTGRDSSGLDTSFKFIATKNAGLRREVATRAFEFHLLQQRQRARRRTLQPLYGGRRLQPTIGAADDFSDRLRAPTRKRARQNFRYFRGRLALPKDAAHGFIGRFGARA